MSIIDRWLEDTPPKIIEAGEEENEATNENKEESESKTEE